MPTYRPEFPYCQREDHIIGNPATKKCSITEEYGIQCTDCRYHQTLFEEQLPDRYLTKIKHILKFAMPSRLPIKFTK